MLSRKSLAGPLALIGLFLGFSLLAVGCSESTTRYTYGHVGWNSSADESVAGIDQAMIRWYVRGGDLVYVVWTDLPGGGGTSGGSSGTSTRQSDRHETSIDVSDGTRFQYEYVLNREEKDAAGDLIIDDVPYDTRLGTLVLISTHGDETEVKQIDVPAWMASLLQAEGHTQESLRNELQNLAQKEIELSSFFGNKDR